MSESRFHGSGGGSRRPAQSSDLRQQNFATVLRTVMQRGPIARSELAELTGMPTGTMTKLTSVLAEAGLVRELPVESAGPGRPRTPIAIDDRDFRVVGVHFGLQSTGICVLDLRGHVVAEIRHLHQHRGFERLVQQAVEGVQSLLAETAGTVLGVGASTGGWVDRAAGIVRDHSVLPWRGAPLRDVLAAGLEFPTEVDSSFRAQAMAERWFGAARDLDDVICLFVGNVVGAGFLLGGNLIRGHTSAAGQIDHLSVGIAADKACACGRRDCLRAVAGDLALLARARRSGVIDPQGKLDELIGAARQGVLEAHQLLGDRAAVVGTAAGTLIEMLDPQAVVVTGGAVDAPEYLTDVQRGTRSYLLGKRDVDVEKVVRLSPYGRGSAAVASASVILERIYAAPADFVSRLHELRYR